MDPQVRLEEYDWEELEEQFTKRMEAFKAVEENIWQEWRDWGEVRRLLTARPLSRMIADGLCTGVQSLGFNHLCTRRG